MTLAELVVDAVMAECDRPYEPGEDTLQISEFVTSFHSEARAWHFDFLIEELRQYERLPNLRKMSA